MPGASPKFPVLPLAIGAGGFALLVTVVVAFAIGFRWNAPARTVASSNVGTVSNVTPPIADPAPVATDDTAVVDVDSLPVVPGGPKAVVGRGSGRLAVIATPGWCTLFVDGASKGPTPVVLDLPTGAHQLRCDPPSGKPRLASINVLEGGAARYRFSLE
jgi:hypothetical protein